MKKIIFFLILVVSLVGCAPNYVDQRNYIRSQFPDAHIEQISIEEFIILSQNKIRYIRVIRPFLSSEFRVLHEYILFTDHKVKIAPIVLPITTVMGERE